MGVAAGFVAPFELPRDEVRQQIDGEQVIDPIQPAVPFQVPQVSEGQLGPQRDQALIGLYYTADKKSANATVELAVEALARGPARKPATDSR